jgi:hypothetical protein
VRGVPFRRAGRLGANLVALLVIASGCVCAGTSARPIVQTGPTSQAAGAGEATDIDSPQSDTVTGANVKAVFDDLLAQARIDLAAQVDAAAISIRTQTATTQAAGRDIRIGDPITAYILAGGLVLALLSYPFGRLLWRRRDGSWRIRTWRPSKRKVNHGNRISSPSLSGQL